jgi:DNA gyrase subunit A
MRSFIAHTHQWVLFFTSRGMAFREKVWQLPEGGAQGKGRSLRQVLALQEGEQITAVLPLPHDESLWEGLHLVFATASGGVRRNKLSDFRNVRAAGLIAMKLDDGDELIGVSTCREGDDVLLATRKGRAIRFQATDDVLRVFAGRDSTGVRGIRLGKSDEVIALSVLRHVEATPAEREAAIRNAALRRRTENGNGNGTEESEASAAVEEVEDGPEEGLVDEVTLSPERARELEEAEEIILAITDGGFGKRSLAYDYRITGRGGQGLEGMLFSRRTGKEVVATFPVRQGDDVMLVTDTGRLIRLPADQVRLTRRRSLGVMLLRLNEGERVNSCFPVVDDQGESATEAGAESGLAQTGALAATEPPAGTGIEPGMPPDA